MYPHINPGAWFPDYYRGDPDDVLGIQNVLSQGAIIGAASGCIPGESPVYGLPPNGVGSCPPAVSCVQRINTINGIAPVTASNSVFSASLYPNPYQGTTIIHINVSEYTNFSIIVYDLVGHIIRQINVASAISFDVPLSDFNESGGLYLIQVSDMYHKQVLKMIKL